MGFHNGTFAKVWKIDDKGKFSSVQISTSRKDESAPNGYVTDFSGFVSFVGEAHNRLKKHVKVNDLIKITSSDTQTTPYEKGKPTYTNHTVFDFELANNNGAKGGNKAKSENKETEEEDSLPY
jgi:hypothetical protein